MVVSVIYKLIIYFLLYSFSSRMYWCLIFLLHNTSSVSFLQCTTVPFSLTCFPPFYYFSIFAVSHVPLFWIFSCFLLLHMLPSSSTSNCVHITTPLFFLQSILGFRNIKCLCFYFLFPFRVASHDSPIFNFFLLLTQFPIFNLSLFLLKANSALRLKSTLAR